MYLNIENIFRPLQIGPATAMNRLMRSATCEAAGDARGFPLLEPMKRIYRDLARGGIGLIVTGHVFVHPNGRASARQIGFATQEQAAAWEPILQAARNESAAPIFVQLNYAGRQGYTHGLVPAKNDKRERFPPPGTPFAEFYDRQIESVIKAFEDAARRAVQVGFDGVQLHLAHGFLLSESLSYHTNKRRDQWGGESRENRRRFALAVVNRVREALGGKLALSVKMNGSDFLPPDGIEPEEAVENARLLARAGVQLIEVSSSMWESLLGAARQVSGPQDEAYLLPLAREVARAVDVAVATVGGYRTVPVMLRALSEGLDMISLSRPLIREPDLPKQFQRNPCHEARCTSCDQCFGIPEGAVRCMLDHPQPVD